MHGFGLKFKATIVLFIFTSCGSSSEESAGGTEGDNMSVIINGEADFSKKTVLRRTSIIRRLPRRFLR